MDFVGDPLYILATKLHRLKKVLRAWSRESFGDIFDKVKMAEKEVLQAKNHFDEDSLDKHHIRLQESRAILAHE